MNAESPTLRHVIMKMANVNDTERILKAAREKPSHMQTRPHKDISRFLCRKLACK